MTWAHTLLTAELLMKLVDKLDPVRSVNDTKETPAMGDTPSTEPSQTPTTPPVTPPIAAPETGAAPISAPVQAPVQAQTAAHPVAPATAAPTAPHTAVDDHLIPDIIELVKILDEKPEILEFLKNIRAVV